MKIKAIDLFCGAGGVTRGLLDAGIDVIAGFDIDTSLQKVYEENNIRQNGIKAKYFNKKVESITRTDIYKLVGSKKERKEKGEKFLLAGCAPCQPFSLKNKNRHDKTDDRRTLITYFADLIKKTKPDFVFMENVAGLATLEPGNLEYFLKTLKDEGFSFDKGIVNAKNYGVAQNRKRFVVLASKEHEVKIPNGEYDGVSKSYKTVGDELKGLPKLKAGERSLIDPIHRCANIKSVKNKKRIKYQSRSEWPEELWLECHKKTTGHGDAYGRMFLDKPAPTLTTKFFSISNGRYGHPNQERAISLREGALLQSFPKDYIFYGESLQTIARQIGNAVPPKMAKEFGKYFYNSIL